MGEQVLARNNPTIPFMKKIFWLIGCLFAVFQVVAQTQENTTLAPTEKSLLWEISGAGLAVPSYLYGTIHLIGEDDFFLTDATQEALQASKQVAFEIDLEDMMNFSSMMPLMMKAFMRGDTTLADLLAPEEYREIKQHFESMGLPFMFLNRLKPMFLSSLDPQGGGQGSEGFVSYEMELMGLAQQLRKPIEGLETAAYQMSMFDSIPYQVQARMLLESIRSGGGEDTDGQFDQMVTLYKNQDIAGMQTMMEAGDELSGYEDLLLGNRNRNWIPVMGKMMTQNATFFAVGAGHLGGEQGVIALLRKAGYTLKPLY